MKVLLQMFSAAAKMLLKIIAEIEKEEVDFLAVGHLEAKRI